MPRRPVAVATILLLLAVGGLGPPDRPPDTSTRLEPPDMQAMRPTSPFPSSGPAGIAVGEPRSEPPDASSRIGAYHADRVIVEVAPELAGEVARRHGLGLSRVSERVGLARLTVPSRRSLDAVVEALARDVDVQSLFPAGRTAGAGKEKDKDKDEDLSFEGYQWHHSAAGSLKADERVAGLTVAILDTGVAYEDHVDALGTYAQASSLAGVEVVHPADFVNGDDHANDDHRHGTHIASIILSDGAVRGVAPGATLMPVKVLDEHNQGDELSLIEGLYHAADHGADVINMSLSFAPGFVPSTELVRALDHARHSGAVLVAAVGNAAAERVTWPAASPNVIAVGASTVAKDGKPMEAWYSNRGAVDLLAPGGEPDADRNGDGYADGILAETFAPGSPTALGFWFQSGTSQAAAFVSGSVLQMLGGGASADEVRATLQSAAQSKHLGLETFTDGVGAGVVDLASAVEDLDKDRALVDVRRHASVLPFLQSLDGTIVPRAQVTVVDDAGEPVEDAYVHALASGTTSSRVHCTTDEHGTCTMSAPSIDDPGDLAAAWAWEVETVEEDGISAVLGTVMFVDLPLEVLVASIEAHEELRNALFAMHWPEGDHPDLGPLVESYTLVNHGTGLLTSPLGIVFTRQALGYVQPTVHSVTLDGSGLVTSPLGLVDVHELRLGLEAMPLLRARLGDVTIVAADGSGLLTSPLGFRSLAMFQSLDSTATWSTTTLGSGLLTSPLGFRSQAVLLTSWQPLTSSLVGTSLGDVLAAGGWTVETGVPGASALLGAGVVEAPELLAFDLGSGDRLMR